MRKQYKNISESISYRDHDDISVEFLIQETHRRRLEMQARGEQPEITKAVSYNQAGLSRRSFLKGVMGGAAATFTLPWLESIAYADNLNPNTPPVRWGCMLFANGVNKKHWWAKEGPGGLELSDSLRPLAPFKEKLLFLENLHIFDETIGVHTPYFTNFLAGETIGNGSIPLLSESCDQYMARTIGRETAIPSLVLGIEPPNAGLSGGKPSIYNSTISWSARTNPIPPEIYPRQLFDRLFDVEGLLRDKSVLDFVNDKASSLKRNVSQHDRDKLDQYMTAIREIEQRIEKATSDDPREGWQPTLSEPNMDRPAQSLPPTTEEHMELMLDLVVLAFQMDKTRIATLLFQKDITGMSFGFLNGVSNTGMHTISHHRNLPNMLEEYRRINHFHSRVYSRFLEKMDAVDEGNGSLLDNSMILFGSTMRDGDIHDANHLPLMICGGKNAHIQGGRVQKYSKLEDRRLCNLHLDLMHRMGLKDLQKFGNSHYALPGISSPV